MTICYWPQGIKLPYGQTATNSAADCDVDDRDHANDNHQLAAKLVSRMMEHDLCVAATDWNVVNT